jgi:hypothetical protein
VSPRGERACAPGGGAGPRVTPAGSARWGAAGRARPAEPGWVGAVRRFSVGSSPIGPPARGAQGGYGRFAVSAYGTGSYPHPARGTAAAPAWSTHAPHRIDSPTGPRREGGAERALTRSPPVVPARRDAGSGPAPVRSDASPSPPSRQLPRHVPHPAATAGRPPHRTREARPPSPSPCRTGPGTARTAPAARPGTSRNRRGASFGTREGGPRPPGPDGPAAEGARRAPMEGTALPAGRPRRRAGAGGGGHRVCGRTASAQVGRRVAADRTRREQR